MSALVLLGALEARAATLSWTGSSAISPNWSDSGNWGFVGTPNNGDTLIFSGGQSRMTNVNDISSLNLNQIRFAGATGGYNISGQAFKLTLSIEATNTSGTNILLPDITLSSFGDFPIDVGTASTLTLGGLLSGNVGLVKNGAGTLILSGSQSNTYTGTTTVNSGVVQNAKAGAPPASGIPGNLIVGNGVSTALVSNLFANEIGDSANITVNNNGTISFNGSDLVGSNLTLVGNATVNISVGLNLAGPSRIISSNGFAHINGPGSLVLGPGPATIDSEFVLYIAPSIQGSSSMTKLGGGDLYFLSANTYTGLTTVAGSGILWISNSLALGTSSAGIVVSNGATLGMLGNITVSNELLILNGPGVPSFASLDYEGVGTAVWAGPVVLNADSSMGVVSSGSVLKIAGPISGAGGLTHFYDNGGTLRFEGTFTNTYGGTTIVATNTILELAVTNSGTIKAVPHSLIVSNGSTVRLFSDYQLEQPNHAPFTDGVTLYPLALLDTQSHLEWIGPLTLIGGRINSGTSDMYYQGDVTVLTNTVAVGRLSGNMQVINGARIFNVSSHYFSPDLYIDANIKSAMSGIIKTGPGEMALAASNSFNSFITVSNGTVQLENSNALGICTNVTVVSGGTLFLYGPLTLPSVPLSLSGTGVLGNGAMMSDFGNVSWPGNITLNSSNASITSRGSPYNLTLGGIIGGPGGVEFDGVGTVTYTGSGANSYAGATVVNSGTLQLNKAASEGAIPNDLVIGDGQGGVNADVVRYLSNNQIPNANTVTISSSGLLDENGFVEGLGGLSGSGNVTASGGVLDFYGSGSYQFDGVISGSGQVRFFGSGTNVFTGPNSYTNQTLVSSGVLRVNGSQPQSAVVVNPGATLGGTGTVGSVLCSGTVAPGASPGVLTTSNLTFNSVGKLAIELFGPNAGTGYDQVNVRGTNSLALATLQLNQAFATPVAVGQQFTLINNDGADPITSSFNGLPNGSSTNVGGFGFTINYAGGTGNDVVLTVTNVPGAGVSATATPGNGDTAIDVNSCNLVTAIFTNLTGTPMTGVTGVLSTTNPSVVITQPNSPYNNVAAFGKGTNTVPFQISVLPSFVCGNDINLNLGVSSSTLGAFSVPLVLHTGATSGATRFDVSVVTNIPDVGTLEVTNVVSGFPAPLLKVEVSLWVTHPLDSDLSISLISPDNIAVLLTTNNGSGANFGSACSPDASRTTFDDAAATSITAGNSPFVGTFRPQGSLASLIRTTPNGNWRLRITDSFGGSLGALRCWSLFLHGAYCYPGGGACAMCPATITNLLTTNSAVQNGRLTRNGIQSVCGAQKTFPNTQGAGVNRHYEAYPFYNGASNACITVSLSSACDYFSAAYLGSFDPSNFSTNYLADPGSSTSGGTTTYSFNVPSNTVYVVTVAEVDSGICGSPYVLNVTGGDCRPVLNAKPVGAQQVEVDWPTIAGGFNLEATPFLAPTNWAPVTNFPIATTNRFSVTNAINPPASKYYRLRK